MTDRRKGDRSIYYVTIATITNRRLGGTFHGLWKSRLNTNSDHRPKVSLTLDRQTVYAMAYNFACQWGKKSWQRAWGWVGIRVMRTRPWREFQTVHVTTRLVTQYARARSLRTVHEMARIWHDNFTVTSRDTVEIFLNISKFFFAWRASIPTHPEAHSFFSIGTPNCVPWRKPFALQVSSLLQGYHTRHLDFVSLK